MGIRWQRDVMMVILERPFGIIISVCVNRIILKVLLSMKYTFRTICSQRPLTMTDKWAVIESIAL